MPLVVSVLTFLAGLLVLTGGAHWFVNGAVRLAEWMRVSRLLVGLTVVAFGTSSPELFLDTVAAMRGATDLAFGDLIGSNIANMGLILGVAAVARPLELHTRLFRIELPIVIAVSAGLWMMSADGEIGRADGLIMLTCFLAFLLFMYRSARLESKATQQELTVKTTDSGPGWNGIVFFVLGLLLLIGGAQLMVISATSIARAIGMSDLVIGLTIVAIGTSLPELATALAASWREESDISIGNVLGSNVFNILFIMGLVAQISPLPVRTESLQVDLPMMFGVVVLFGVLVARGMRLSRVGGAMLLCAYVTYLCIKIF